MTDIRETIARARNAGVILYLGLTADNKQHLPDNLRGEIGGRKAEIIRLLAEDLLRKPPPKSFQVKAEEEPVKRIFPVSRQEEPLLLRERPKQWGPAADEPIKGDFCGSCHDGQFFQATAAGGWACSWCVCGSHRDPWKNVFTGRDSRNG